MNQPVFTTYDYAIGGKMVIAKAEMDDIYSQLMRSGDPDAIRQVKQSLIHQMAEFMLENGLVEFTHQDDPMTMRKRVAVRAYLAPNDQIKILRSTIKV